MTDAEIVMRVRNGDIEAYTLLVDRHRNAVYGLAFDALQNFEDARDVAQEVFIRAYVHLDQLREPQSFAPWLRRMTTNACRMQRRSRRPTEALDETTPLPGHAERIDAQIAIQQAMQCLSPASRLTLTLFHLGEYSLSEISAFLDVPVSTVKSRLSDARARLRKEIEMVEDTLKQQSLPDEFAELTRQLIQAGEAKDEARFHELLAHPTHGAALWQEMMRQGQWQRITKMARLACARAQEEAAQRQSEFVEIEHLLLGLIRENESGAACVLRELGFDEESLRQAVNRNDATPRAESVSSENAEPELSPRAKDVLVRAASEAKESGERLNISSDIGTEHILLALLDEDTVSQVLRERNLNSAIVREKVASHLSATRAQEPS